MCGVCATATPQHNVQAQALYMDLSGIRHLLSHVLQTMHCRPSHGPWLVACHVQFVCTANSLQAKNLNATELRNCVICKEVLK